MPKSNATMALPLTSFSLIVAQKSTCPASLLIAPEVVVAIGGGGVTICTEANAKTVPTVGMTVSVRAIKLS